MVGTEVNDMSEVVRGLERWMLLTAGLLVIGLGEEWATELLRDWVGPPWKRALVIMVAVGMAYALAVEVLAPWIQKYVRRVHGAVKPGRGQLAGMLGAIVVVGLVYVGYYFTYR
jgi:hypothetical protein